jgi:DNA-binding MarR family transcriptional regulator
VERQLTYLLRQATMAMRATLRDTLAEVDVSAPQNNVLHLLAAEPGSSPAELARRAYVTPQTMHKLIVELQARGLLELQPRPGHGRILEAQLTEKGHTLLAEVEVRAKAVEDRMTAGLDGKQRQDLLDLLQHCVDTLDIPDDPKAARKHEPTTTPPADST